MGTTASTIKKMHSSNLRDRLNVNLIQEPENILESIQQIIKASYQRTANFFMNSNNYISYFDEMKMRQIEIGIVNSVDLECTGHGSFAPLRVATRFIQNLEQLMKYNDGITRIKIKLSGLDLGQQLILRTNEAIYRNLRLIEWLVIILSQKVKALTSLEIRICNVRNCKMKDFKAIMQLGLNIEAKELTNFSCEFSDWSFAKLQTHKEDHVKDYYIEFLKKKDKELNRHYQPNINQFMSMLQGSLEKTKNKPLIQLKKFRLQISTWYYTDYEIENFFQNTKLIGIQNLSKQDKIPQRIQYFHHELKSRIQNFIRELMIGLTNLELDFRNWNKKFEMGMLQNSLFNVSCDKRRNSLTYLSRPIENHQEEEAKSFDLVVVV